jgi:hypothetical protein
MVLGQRIIHALIELLNEFLGKISRETSHVDLEDAEV